MQNLLQTLAPYESIIGFITLRVFIMLILLVTMYIIYRLIISIIKHIMNHIESVKNKRRFNKMQEQLQTLRQNYLLIQGGITKIDSVIMDSDVVDISNAVKYKDLLIELCCILQRRLSYYSSLLEFYSSVIYPNKRSYLDSYCFVADQCIQTNIGIIKKNLEYISKSE